MGVDQRKIMATLWWSAISWFFVPSGLFFFLLLSLPFGFLGPVRGFVVRFLNSLSPVEGLNIATVFFVGCLCCLYWEFMHYADKEALWAANKAGGSGGVHHHGQHWELLANKWRAERNLWIAAMSSFVWFAVWSLSVHVSRHRNFVAQKAAEEEPVEQIVFSQFANNLFVLYPVCSAR